MQQKKRKCQNCDSNLTLVNSFPSAKYARTLYFSIANWVGVLNLIMLLVAWVFEAIYGIVLFVTGFIVLMALAKMKVIKFVVKPNHPKNCVNASGVWYASAAKNLS